MRLDIKIDIIIFTQWLYLKKIIKKHLKFRNNNIYLSDKIILKFFQNRVL